MKAKTTIGKLAMIRTRIIPLLPLVLVFGLAACGGDNGGDTTVVEEGNGETRATTESNAAAPSGKAVRSGKVAMVDFSFEPSTVTIQTGGKVIWKNDGAQPHTATADNGSFDTGAVEPGKLKSESLKVAGTVTYSCTIHPQMKGTVEVVD